MTGRGGDVKARRFICMFAAHQDRMVQQVGSGRTEALTLQCERCGRRTNLPGSGVEAGRYTWDFGPD